MTARQSDDVRELKSKLQKIPIAVIGMGCLFPEARDLREYWDNIVNKVNAIKEVPPSRWDVNDYYDPDPMAPDKTYSKWGGFLPSVDFDPLEFGIPPNILEVTDVSQLLALVVAKEVLEDAGYGESSGYDRDKIGIILGVGGGQKLISPLNSRLQYPVWREVFRKSGISEKDTEILVEKIKKAYIPWEENSFPGMLGNVVSGRVTNRLGLGGTNCVVDAACATSLAAMKMAVSELLEYRSELMISGGVDTDNSYNMFLCFSKTPAFSPSDHCKPFDSDSDGILIGEGIGMVALKRLADAERDGDRIYAVIRGIGTSSDGRYKSIYNPRAEGQAKALREAYKDAGVSPASIELVEAHGTGTKAGDPVEISALKEVFGEQDSGRQHIAVGSVKSQIGHTKASAGVAGLIKAALALHHKVLPPTINITRPDPKLELEESPFYLNTETRPWIHSENGFPRRAGVSAFGFGGTNFHFVLEEYEKTGAVAQRLHRVAQSVFLSASTPEELKGRCAEVVEELESEAGERLYEELLGASKGWEAPRDAARIGFVSGSLSEACELLRLAAKNLETRGEEASWALPKGVYYRREAMDLEGKVVALFSGQGSQYVEMGRELVFNFPPLMEAYRQMDGLFLEEGWAPLSEKVFPKPVFDAEDRTRDEEELRRTEYAQPAIGAFSAGLYKVFEQGGFQADYVAGHSFGELTALWAAKVLRDEDYFALARARGKAMAASAEAGFDPGAMIAVIGEVEKVRAEASDFPGVTVANLNSRQEVVLAGPSAEMARARKVLKERGYRVVPLPVSAAFHTSLVGHAQEPFAKAIDATAFERPERAVYSNTTGNAYPTDPGEIRELLKGHILNSVLFKEEVENIYRDGGRLFVEFGPKGILSKLVGNILEDKPHMAVALNGNAKKGSDRQLRQAVVQLRVAGLPLQDMDPYQVEPPLPSDKKPSPATVRLTGANYKSEKTRKAFEDALNDGHKIAQAKTPVEVSTGTGPAKREVVTEAPAQATVPSGAPASAKESQERTPPPAPPTGKTTVDAQRLLESVEQGLALFFKHQGETLQAHQQYLSNDLEYARTSYELMRQQYGLSGSAPISESVERGMAMFHDHQAETLRVHDQYLRNQAEVSRSALEVMKQQTTALTGVSPPAASTTIELPGRPAVQRLSGPVAPADPPKPPTPLPVVQAAPPVLEQPLPSPPPSAPTPAAPAAVGPSIEALTQSMLQVVSEKTGYPVEMLELDMEMEADLGIDSIKRVEILGTMMDLYPDLPELNPEEMAELKILAEIVGHIKGHLAGPGAPTTEPAAPATPPPPAAPAPVGPSIEALTQSMLQVVSEKTGYPVEMLELDMEMEADLGIDSIKRVEILGTMMDLYPDLPELNPEEMAELKTLAEIVDHIKGHLAGAGAPTTEPAQPPAPPAAPAAAGPSIEALTQSMLRVVSEKTGYPVEMLELDMEMEADLGIDSIKRVEILGTMMDLYPDLPELNPEEMAELKTLAEIVDHIKGHLAGPGGSDHGNSRAKRFLGGRSRSKTLGVIREAGETRIFVNAFKISGESAPQIWVGSWTSHE